MLVAKRLGRQDLDGLARRQAQPCRLQFLELSGVKGPEGLCHQKQEETSKREASSPLRRDADAMLKHAIAWLHVAHLVMGVVQTGGQLQRCE
ncbi:MAG: hypothetical protein CBC83_10020 [Flavobacteriales bacterium TMED123]|nr:MAG: hypothetical protein CBC83_10020 [Flavobacteriales bacterium TMED123]